MFRSLRNQLIASHILPLLVIIPLMAGALFYVLETRVLLPQLANSLVQDARLLMEISTREGEIWGNPYYFDFLVRRIGLNPSLRVMFLTPGGRLLYSSDAADNQLEGEILDIPGLGLAQAGKESALTNYSILRLHNILIDVLEPVVDAPGSLIGLVRVSYRIASVYELLAQTRTLIVGVLLFGLVFGVILSSILSFNINRPVQRVTQAMYELARGGEQEGLEEQGPEEMRRQIRAVNYLVARLRNLEQARRHLLANLVHELGRPLGALRSAVHALATGAANDPVLLQDLTQGMEQEMVQVNRVLDDLAHLRDQELGALEMKCEKVALSEWLPGVICPWQEAALEKKQEWHTDIPENLPAIDADPVRLAQIVGNLVDNAVKYTPLGGKVEIEAGTEGEQVWIRVGDNGQGIPIEEQKKIFTPFFRGVTARRIKQGMGLGLSIAQELAEAHRGKIEVQSLPGQGSQFTLWLPVQVNRSDSE